MWPTFSCLFFIFPMGEIELSHMGKDKGNSDLVCEKTQFLKIASALGGHRLPSVVLVFNRLALILPNFCHKNVICLLGLLQIFKNALQKNFTMEANIMNPDQIAPPQKQSDLGPKCLQYMYRLSNSKLIRR